MACIATHFDAMELFLKTLLYFAKVADYDTSIIYKALKDN